MIESSSKEYISINKYWLYLIIVSLVFGIFLLPKLYYLQTYSKAYGKVSGYHDVEVHHKRGSYTKRYPIIQFETSKYIVKILAPEYIYNETRSRSNFPVLYNPNNPEKAFVFTKLAYWGESFKYLIPFFLCWTALIFGVGFLPKNLKINKYFYKKILGS